MKKLVAFSLLIIGIVGLTGCNINKIEETKKEEISSNGISKLVIDAGSGELTVQGDKDAKTIKVIAVIKRSDNVDKDTFILNLDSSGDTANLEIKQKPLFFTIASYRSMDVNVIVPEHLNVDLEDGSGDLTVKNVTGNVTIKDGSGEMYLENIPNLERIDDGSGDILIKKSAGDLKLKDGSGDMDIIDFTGDITIDDGSGDMDVSNVSGSVEVKDGSGDIAISHIDKDVTIIDAGSGDLHLDEINGTVSQ